MPKYKLKKIKLAEYKRTLTKSKQDPSRNEDEVQFPEDGADGSDDKDDAPEEVTFSTSKNATMETVQHLRGTLQDIEEKKKEKRKRIQERNTRQKLEKQKAVGTLVEDSSESRTVSTAGLLPQSLPTAAFSDDGDDDDDDDDVDSDAADDDDDDTQADTNQSDGDDQLEVTEDHNFIPLTRGIKVIPLTKKVNKTANSTVNFRQQSLYGGRIKRDSAKDHFLKKKKKQARKT